MKTNIRSPVMRDGLQGRSYLEDLDCLGTVLLVKVGELRELRRANGLVEAENRSTGMQTIPLASNKVLPEILIPRWLLAALETHSHRLFSGAFE